MPSGSRERGRGEKRVGCFVHAVVGLDRGEVSRFTSIALQQ